jgi:hypothetical protein
VVSCQRKPPKSSYGRLRKRWLVQSNWPGNSTRERGTMAYRMTRGAQRMSTQTKPLQGGTILSSTHDATLIEIDSDIDHDRFMRNSARPSTRESKFTARWLTTPWLQGCWLIKSPPISPRIMKRSTHMSSGSRRCWM